MNNQNMTVESTDNQTYGTNAQKQAHGGLMYDFIEQDLLSIIPLSEQDIGYLQQDLLDVNRVQIPQQFKAQPMQQTHEISLDIPVSRDEEPQVKRRKFSETHEDLPLEGKFELVSELKTLLPRHYIVMLNKTQQSAQLFYSHVVPKLPTVVQKSEDGSLFTVNACFASNQAMSLYLNDVKDSELVFYTPRIGQKSYGNEKRFFSPSPQVVLRGVEWFKEAAGEELFVKTIEAGISSDASGYLKQNATGGSPITVFDKQDSSEAVLMFKNMFISDLQKIRETKTTQPLKNDFLNKLFLHIGQTRVKKEFEFYLSLNLLHDHEEEQESQHVGTFRSDVLSVISKPSKRKSAVSLPSSAPAFSAVKPRTLVTRSDRDERAAIHQEAIISGTQIALFNRLRSQTASTRYLTAKNKKLFAATNQWNPFTIRAIDGPNEAHSPIVFGSRVRLEFEDGWQSDELIVFQVDPKTNRSIGSVSPSFSSSNIITHFQKISFQHAEDSTKFFSINEKAECGFAKFKGSDIAPLPDCSIWTIIGVSYSSYRWFDPQPEPQLPVTPVPEISFNAFIRLSDITNSLYLEISMPAHAVLETADLYTQVIQQSLTFTQTIQSLFCYDVFLANVACEIMSIDFCWRAEDGLQLSLEQLSALQQKSNADLPALDELVLGVLVRFPSVSELSEKGGWYKNFNHEALAAGTEQLFESAIGHVSLHAVECDPSVYLDTGFPFSVASVSDVDRLKLKLPLILVRRHDGIVYRTRNDISFEFIQ